LTLGRRAGTIQGSSHPTKGTSVKRILVALVAVALSIPAWAGPPVNAHAPPMDKIELTPDQIAAIGRYVSSLKK
jgi:hypothetical protein